MERKIKLISVPFALSLTYSSSSALSSLQITQTGGNRGVLSPNPKIIELTTQIIIASRFKIIVLLLSIFTLNYIN